MPRDARATLLLAVYDQAFRPPAWHGTPLGATLRGVSWRDALRRPARGRHCIWELVLHAAYWKREVRRRLTGGRAPRFPRAPADWPAVPARPGPAAWRADVALLAAEHRKLRAVIAAFPARRLARPVRRARWTAAAEIYGVASHDLYHAGQIQLVKALLAGRKATRR